MISIPRDDGVLNDLLSGPRKTLTHNIVFKVNSLFQLHTYKQTAQGSNKRILGHKPGKITRAEPKTTDLMI